MSKNSTNAALSLASGLLSGIQRGQELKRQRAREDKKDSQDEAIFNARMEEAQAARDQRIALKNATAPAQVDAGYQVTDTNGSQAFTKDPDAAAVLSDMSATTGAEPTSQAAQRVNGQVYSDPKLATRAADDYNSPDATLKRQAAVVQATDPAKAITLTNAAIETRKRQQEEADNATFRRINGLKSPEDMANFVSEYSHDGHDGGFKSEVVYSPDKKTFSFMGIKPDGTRMKMPVDFSNDEDGMMKARMQLAGQFSDPNKRIEYYKWEKESERKQALADAAERNARANERRADAAERNAQTRAAGGGSGGSGNLSDAERKRYTTLLTESSRRLGEASKSLTTLQKDPIWARRAAQPGTPQAQQLANLQQTIETHTAEREKYQGLLANSQTGGSTDSGTPKPSQSGGIKDITSAEERDALPKGARYRAPNGQVYIKQ